MSLSVRLSLQFQNSLRKYPDWLHGIKRLRREGQTDMMDEVECGKIKEQQK
jgi:hypothetical protein